MLAARGEAQLSYLVMARPLLLSLFAATLACSVSTVPRKPLPSERPDETRPLGAAVHYEHGEDAPEISRVAGAEGAVVILWPRIVPKSEAPEAIELATRIQARLRMMASNAGAKETDVRPAPERVCPRPSGCRGLSVGAVLSIKDKACAVAIVVGPAGPTNVELLPLAGSFEFKAASVPFREPPESFVTITEFAKCEDLLGSLDKNEVLPGQVKAEEKLKAML